MVSGNKTLPTWIQWVIPACVCFSTFGASNGTLFGAARLTYASAREGHLMTTLSYCDVKRKTPSAALYFLTILSCLYVLPADFGTLLNYFSFTAWIFYGLTVLGVIVMRFTQPDRDRPIRVPLVIPIIFVAISSYLVVAPLIDNFEWEYVGAVLFILLGLLVYYLPVVHFKYKFTFMNPVISLVQCLLAIAPSAYNEDEDRKENVVLEELDAEDVEESRKETKA